MRNAEISDAIILGRLNEASKAADLDLTYGHKLFFLRLLNLCILEGADTDSGYEISKSTVELAKALNVSPRMVTQCLNRLLLCGAIHRREGNKAFPHSPFITTIEPSFYK